jgi:transcriptional regulator with XRE-family HTH domain
LSGAHLRFRRERLNESLRSFAELAFISPSYLQEIEAGKAKPSVDIQAGIATTLHMLETSKPGLDADAPLFDERRCRVCGCTDENCLGCFIRTGRPCEWVEDDLCSACIDSPEVDRAR